LSCGPTTWGRCGRSQSPAKWIDQYEYYPNGMMSIDAERILIPASEIIHLKWPSIDLAQPWVALPPLRAVAMEVNSDTEMTRYIYALLANDAVARTVISLPAGSQLTNTQFSRLEEQFKIRHGGERRGGVGIVEGGATINRMALNLQELAIEALRRIPESRIAGALRVPAALAGLYVGLEKMTY
jgi:phage portal protein BeeE